MGRALSLEKPDFCAEAALEATAGATVRREGAEVELTAPEQLSLCVRICFRYSSIFNGQYQFATVNASGSVLLTDCLTDFRASA